MLAWSITFLVVALLAGLFGFWALAGVAATVAQVLFFVFLVLFVIGLIVGRRATARVGGPDPGAPGTGSTTTSHSSPR